MLFIAFETAPFFWARRIKLQLLYLVKYSALPNVK